MATIAFEHVTKRFPDGTVAVDDLNLSVGEGEFLILVGPSGCGKTTALRMIAGLEEVSDGEVRIGANVVNDVPPARRDVAMVFQNYALYPHMTIQQNISFPLRQQHLPKAEIEQRVGDAARLLGIEDLLARKPKELSGGQRQRVAMGRALVRRPQAFLMDEPLSNLDAKLRVQMRAELIDLHRRLGVTTVYVTHDQTEAMTLGDRVVVLDKGVVQQVDPPEQLYRHPANTFVASFIGSPAMNFLEGQLGEGVVQLGPWSVELPEALARRVGGRSGDVLVGLRPEDFALANGSSLGAARLPAEIQITEQLGPEMLAHFRVDGLRVAYPEARRRAVEGEESRELGDTVIGRFAPNAPIAAGDRAEVVIDRERIQLFDPATGVSLVAV
jgi:multiple sugar transport system ATP-binding protein